MAFATSSTDTDRVRRVQPTAIGLTPHPSSPGQTNLHQRSKGGWREVFHPRGPKREKRQGRREEHGLPLLMRDL